MIMSLAWNFPLKLSSSTIFRGAESSDSVMSPNKLFSCDCNFFPTLLKDKSPVYHVFSKLRQGVIVVAYMKGRAGSLNEYYPITAHVPN